MKLTNEKEMDILLSRLARRRETGVPDEFRSGAGDSSVDGGDNGTSLMNGTEHLDADELNAYAENALLPAARARYTAHLADCETCRKLVTDLALAGGGAATLDKSAATPTQDISKDKSWWQSLTALFTLPVVRYGVPALALLAIISVAYISTRQRTDSALVAQNKEPVHASAIRDNVEENHPQAPSESAKTNAPTDEKTQSDISNSATTANNNTDQFSVRTREKNDSDSPKESGAGKEVVPSTRTDADALSSSTPSAGPPAPLSKAGEVSTRPETASKAGPPKDNPAQSADEVASAPTPQQQRDDSFGYTRESTSGARAVEQRRQQQQQQQARSMDRGRDMTIDGTEENASPLKDKQAKAASPSANASVARKRAAGPMKSESKVASESAPANENAGEKRNVGGRTFRRQGSAWVDTAYNSSRATVNVSRGSEQYRALLADEPTLRTIAEQLGGEVIVVWKNRAYRIH
ncbi:MAG TPA: hypothetical protein VGO91_04805 [Pyrinomonadaceae bacterium]|jgi:hypothetical protein|nr:hypothetical protein [Pyrinomonadaceae bacterium]